MAELGRSTQTLKGASGPITAGTLATVGTESNFLMILSAILFTGPGGIYCSSHL